MIGSLRTCAVHTVASLVALAGLTLARSASAQIDCADEGTPCPTTGIASTCTAIADRTPLCLADPRQICRDALDGDPCMTFTDAGGVCRPLRGALICVPTLVSAACEGIGVGSPCTAEDDAVGRCYPSAGVLTCVPDECAGVPLETDCTGFDQQPGWCRVTPDGPETWCSQACVAERGDCFYEGAPDGECLPNDAGELVCTFEGAPCLEGSSCTTDEGEPGECGPRGGAGTLDCVTDEEREANREGCCGGPQVEARSSSRPTGLVALGIVAAFARRGSRRRDRPGVRGPG